jgi:regulatory protein
MPPREPSLRERALRLLAGREHSQAELRRKLSTHAETEAQLDELIEDLVARKLVSDARYAEARSHVMARKYGASRIAHDLRAKGVSDDEAGKAIEAARSTDLERAREIYARKYRRAIEAGSMTREDRAKRMRFLQARGFSFAIIRFVMEGDGSGDEGGDED